MKRNETRPVYVGNLQIGGQNKCILQSMTNVPAKNVEETIQQILELEENGCELIRIAVLDEEDARAIPDIKKGIHIPLVADIHFNHRLALIAADGGVDAIRINPGNIGSREHTEEVVKKCKEKHIPIRIGINGGSLEKQFLEQYGGLCAEAMIASCDRHVKILEELDFHDIVLSFKSSDVELTIDVYEKASQHYPYPLHLGVTEAGGFTESAVKSSAALGTLLHEGIGDTIRVSLTGDPVEEIKSAKLILKTLGLRKGGIEVVSCPTCGRTKIDLIGLANQVQDMVADIPLDIKVAVMGCVVNGPGEAKEADIGIAGGCGEGLLIKKGEIVKKVKEEELLETLRQELLHWNE